MNQSRRFSWVVLVCLIVGFSGLSTLACHKRTRETKRPLPTKPDTTDVVWEEHMLRKVFDPAYTGPYDLGYTGKTALMLPEWEDVYFNREVYRHNFIMTIKRNWSVGSMFWQAKVRVKVPSELIRGGPIIFELRYPLIEFRKPFTYTVSKDASGHTVVVYAQPYRTPRLGYLLGGILTVVLLLIFMAGLVLIGYFLKWLWKLTVNWVAERVMPGQGQSLWARRFAACLVGAGLCIAIFVVMLTTMAI